MKRIVIASICFVMCGCAGIQENGLFGRQAHECSQVLSMKEEALKEKEEQINRLKAQVASQDLRINQMNATIQEQQQKLRGFGVF